MSSRGPRVVAYCISAAAIKVIDRIIREVRRRSSSQLRNQYLRPIIGGIALSTNARFPSFGYRLKWVSTILRKLGETGLWPFLLFPLSGGSISRFTGHARFSNWQSQISGSFLGEGNRPHRLHPTYPFTRCVCERRHERVGLVTYKHIMSTQGQSVWISQASTIQKKREFFFFYLNTK